MEENTQNSTQTEETQTNSAAEAAAEVETEVATNEDAERADRLENELKAMKKRLDETQRAAEAANRERKKLERAQMSDAQQQEDLKRETEEYASKYKRLIAGANAKQVFAGTGLSEDMYSPILELITTEDEARTESIAQEIKLLLESQAKSIEKSVREKILKETPAPPAGGDKGGFDANYTATLRKTMGLR